jgi:hypothetical protein
VNIRKVDSISIRPTSTDNRELCVLVQDELLIFEISLGQLMIITEYGIRAVFSKLAGMK